MFDVLANSSPSARVTSPRRLFLARAGLLGAAALGSGLIGSSARTLQAAETAKFGPKKKKLKDEDILNFALNLEYLEAEFYSRAAFGRGLTSDMITGKGTQGTVSGGRQVDFQSSVIRQYAEEIASDEIAHVNTLRATLGKNAVAEPALNLDTAFTAAAVAAGIIPAGQTFDPYASDDNFLLGAFIFEDVGVTAYHGAAPFISNTDYLDAAAGILAVEAYHAGIIRATLFSLGQDTPALITGANAISALRMSADDPGVTNPPIEDQGLTDSNGHGNLIPSDELGFAFSRTFQEVLNVVYLGGAAADFGFFPSRTNGVVS